MDSLDRRCDGLTATDWLKHWLFTTNHKEVGVLYFFTSCYFGFIGAILALMMRVQLSIPNNNFLSAFYYDQAVTMHGLIMIFWFLSPIAIGLANYFVPLQIGARDLAFPRLNAMSYWLYLAGGVLALLSFFVPGGTASAGWTTYQPLAVLTLGTGPTLAYLGLVLLSASVTLGSVNFLVSIIWMRAPRLTLSKLPMFTWFILFTVIAMLFAFPTLIAAFILASTDRLLGTSFFTSTAIQPSILWDNLFWFFGHPEVYIVLLPGFGIIANILPQFTGRPLAAKNAILVATGLIVIPLSFGVWMHHMFLTGIPVALQGAFSVATIAISIPFDVITLSFVESLIRGRVKFATPMLFALGAVILFIIGGITGVFLSSPVLDRVFRGSYFVVSHFHYVMVGAAIFGIIAGIYYWLPRMTGHMYNERLGKIHFAISFVGFNILYFPMNLLYDMPRRIFTYPNVGDWATLNGLASVGAFVFALAQVLLAYNVLHTWFRGPMAPSNPWGAPDLEWTTHAEGMTPAVVSTAPPAGGWIGQLSATEGSSAPGGSPVPEGHAVHLSSRPLELSLGLLLFLAGAPFYPDIAGIASMVLGALVIIYAFWGWGMDDLHDRFTVPPETEGDRWPFHAVPKLKLGMWVFLSSEVILFGSFLGAYIFIRAAAANWPAAGTIHDIPLGTANTLILVTSGLTMFLAVQAIRNGDQRKLLQWLAVTFVLGAVFMGIKVSEWTDLANLAGGGFVLSNPTYSLAASAYYIIVGLHGAHVTAGLLMMIYLMKKTTAGHYSKESHEAIENFGLYWAFVDIVWCFVFPLFYLL
ncbi:MAG: cbb3-type cytochrome c oxidase subunit I [Nitrososphaerota archaeon]|nr:cbb3-type cytochrome c oxidase subunit I [Nitrososphaerota archaeon]MDG7023047.1 cbb3-type cytochrome c oxidase subunit I [Nitrososphaerota archaeon]